MAATGKSGAGKPPRQAAGARNAKAAAGDAGKDAAGDATGAPARPTLRRKELVDRVVAATGAKKKAVRDIVEATLKVLGEALAADESLALPPFGKARVNRHRDLATGEVMTVRLRRRRAATAGQATPETVPESAGSGDEALAKADE